MPVLPWITTETSMNRPENMPFPRSLQNSQAGGPKRVVVAGHGEVFRNKIKPALEFMGIHEFLIFSPSYQGGGKLINLEDAPSDSLVLILSPNKFHLEQALICLNIGLPFYMEKPLAIDQAEIDRFTDAFSGRQLAKCCCGDYYFFKALPLLAFFLSDWRLKAEPWLSALPPRGVFGDVVRVEGRLFESGHDLRGTLEHRAWLTKVASGGGMLLDLMVHFTNIFLLLGYSFDKLSSCALYKNIDGQLGCFTPLDSDAICEDRAEVRGFLNGHIPFSFEVSKYAERQDRWLKFHDRDNRQLVMRFDLHNTLEIISPNSDEPKAEICLRVDPYLLTMSEALHFLLTPGPPARLYFEEQAASICLIEKMKTLYFKGPRNDG